MDHNDLQGQVNGLTNRIVELQSGFQEVGSVGLNAWGGIINDAYNRELYWPDVAPVYNRIFRSDPEASVARIVLDAMAAKLTMKFVVHPTVEHPTDDDNKAIDFGNQVLDDMTGGYTKWLTSCVSRVPFYGWGWWEVVPAMRIDGWRPPGGSDWRSEYNDGLVGIRELAFRHYSSFYGWDLEDKTLRLRGLYQNDPPNPVINIPLERSLHIVFGDQDSPEGLATMEAMWRLEGYKRNLEMIQGIGFEHAAGIAKFTTSGDLDDSSRTIIGRAARAMMTAQEGNYVALPNSIAGEIIDTNFSAAQYILEAIRYYGILKLALLGMQWAAMGTLSPYGSYSSVKDANEFFLNVFNSMVEGFVNQADKQIGRRLFNNPVNAAAFPGMTRRPILSVSRAQKVVDLNQLGSFMQAMQAAGMALGSDDWISVRQKSDFLPETPPPDAETIEQEPIPDETETADTAEGDAVEDTGDQDGESMLSRSLELPGFEDGVMVAFFVPSEIGEVLQVEGMKGALTPYEMHVSLVYLGTINDVGDRVRLENALAKFASKMPVIDAVINGPALFNGDDTRTLVALVDSPNLPGFRAGLLEVLDRIGVSVVREHGFIPHITLAYLTDEALGDLDITDIASEELLIQFDKVYLAWGREVTAFDLGGPARDLVRRPFMVDGGEYPVDVLPLADDLDNADDAIKKFKKWARTNDKVLFELLTAEVKDSNNVDAV